MASRLKPAAIALVLVCVGSLVLPAPTFAQAETVGGLLIKIAGAAGFPATTATDALLTLVSQRLITQAAADALAPQIGFALTRGTLARIMEDVLHLPLPPGASTQDVVDALARRGIIPGGPADSIVTSEQVTAILTNPTVAASLSAAIIPVVPLSPLVVVGVATAEAGAVASQVFAPVSP